MASLQKEREELHSLLEGTDTAMEAQEAAHSRGVVALRRELADAEAQLRAGTANVGTLEAALQSERALAARLHADMKALRSSTSGG